MVQLHLIMRVLQFLGAFWKWSWKQKFCGNEKGFKCSEFENVTGLRTLPAPWTSAYLLLSWGRNAASYSVSLGSPLGGMRALCRTLTVRQTQQEEGWWKPSEQSVPIALAQGSGNTSVPSSLALCRNQRCHLPRSRGEMRCVNNFPLDWIIP